VLDNDELDKTGTGFFSKSLKKFLGEIYLGEAM